MRRPFKSFWGGLTMGSYLVLLDFLPTASESKYIKFAGRAKAANPEREYAEERNFAHFQSISQTNTGNSRLRTTSEKLVQHADGYQPFSAWLTSRPKYLYSEPPKPVKINNGPSPTRCDIVSRSSLYAPECSAPGSMEKPRPLLITGTGRVGTTYVQKLLFSLGLDIRHDAHDDPSCFNSQHCGLQGAVSWVHLYTDAGFQLAPKKSSNEQKVKRQSNNLSMAFPDQIYTENAEDNLVRYCKLPKWSWSPSGQRFRVVVHLVRDPLKSIQSRSNMNRRSIEWIGTYVACVTDILPQYVLDQKDLSRPVHWADAAREMFHHLPVSAVGGDRSTLHTSNLKLLVSLRHFITWNSFAENIAQLRWRIEDFGYSSIEKLCAILPSLWGSRGCPSSKTFRVVQAKLKNDTNHDHVRVRSQLSKEVVTWDRLTNIDFSNSVLAQCMGLRYGYRISDGTPHAEARSIFLKEMCKSIENQTEYGFTDRGQWYYHWHGRNFNMTLF